MEQVKSSKRRFLQTVGAPPHSEWRDAELLMDSFIRRTQPSRPTLLSGSR